MNRGMRGSMKMADGLQKAVIAGLMAGLIAAPAWAKNARNFVDTSIAGDTRIAQAAQEPDHFVEQQSEQDRRDAEQDAREQEQEKKEQEQERVEQMQELYDDAREALDDGKYQEAEKKFTELAKLNGPQADAALYWKAYTENQAGKRDTALATIANLKAKFPQSRWKKDGEALEIEVRQSTGHPVNPDSQNDAELKTLALRGIMNGDPERGVQLIEKQLAGSASPKDKAQMLFVLAQSGSPRAQEVLAKIALGQNNPELQRKAVEYIGIFGVSGGVEGGVEGGVQGGVQGGVKGGVNGPRRSSGSNHILGQVYASTTDESVKRAVIRSYMISGNRDGLFQLAKNENNENLKREAIRNLGLVGGQNELLQLYQSEPSTEVRREILQGFFLSGQSEKLVQVAENDKDMDLRRTAIRNLGLMGKTDVLQSIYAKETDRQNKEEVLNAYFLSGNAKALVAIAKSEKDAELKKRAVEKLSLMNSKEGSEYLMELLNK
jgi:hypothetical protein